MTINWPKITFPPINLWSLPNMSVTGNIEQEYEVQIQQLIEELRKAEKEIKENDRTILEQEEVILDLQHELDMKD